MNHKTPGVLFGILLLLLGGAVLLFLAVGEDYYQYTSVSAQGAADAAPLDKETLIKLAHPVQEKLDTSVKFRNFFLTAPGAKKVELQADFNAWGKVPLVLQESSRNYFEISVALAPGDYKYVFVVDGQEMLDPTNLDRTHYEGRTVCIKTVR